MDLEIVVPVLTLRAPDGRLDLDATARYAERAARTWADKFIISGSTSRGNLLTVAERARILDLWSQAAHTSRLVACCWCADDLRETEHRGIQPITVMRGLADQRRALAFFAELSPGTYVYSHPMHSRTVLDAVLAAAARQKGTLPAGAKISKIPVGQIATIRAATGSDFGLWDGSSRHIRASWQAGASGVVVTPLSYFPAPFPERSPTHLQAAIDPVQSALDREPSRDARTRLLTTLARG